NTAASMPSTMAKAIATADTAMVSPAPVSISGNSFPRTSSVGLITAPVLSSLGFHQLLEIAKPLIPKLVEGAVLFHFADSGVDDIQKCCIAFSHSHGEGPGQVVFTHHFHAFVFFGNVEDGDVVMGICLGPFGLDGQNRFRRIAELDQMCLGRQ